MHLTALWGDVKAMICCRGVINHATHLEHHIYCPITVVKQSIRGWLRCSPTQNNKVDPDFYWGAPLPSIRYFLTLPSIFEKGTQAWEKVNTRNTCRANFGHWSPLWATLLNTMVWVVSQKKISHELKATLTIHLIDRHDVSLERNLWSTTQQVAQGGISLHS